MTRGPASEPVRLARLLPAAPLAIALLLGCGGDSSVRGAPEPNAVLMIGGIPDQEAFRLERMFGLMADYLERSTGVRVGYAPATDYPALVSAFQSGDVQLAWFGGLTGVQARVLTPGSRAIVQRPRDREFHSVFIVGSDVAAGTLPELAGLSFTFGNEASTSGHLMPRYFLRQAGLDADTVFAAPPGYSGSHDATFQLVESGAYQAGALNEAVWEAAVAERRVDTTKVRVLLRTPPYFDYHWAVRGDVDQRFGAGTTDEVIQALLDLDRPRGAAEAELLDLFATDRFVPTENSNYDAIRAVAEELGVLR